MTASCPPVLFTVPISPYRSPATLWNKPVKLGNGRMVAQLAEVILTDRMPPRMECGLPLSEGEAGSDSMKNLR